MTFVEWNKSFSVGVKMIDAQHKKLFALINDVHSASIGKEIKGDTTLDIIIHELMAYVDFHFKTEEKYFHEFGYEKTKEHEKQHKFYEDKIRDFYKRYLEGDAEIELMREIIIFIRDWILNHIKINDKEYTKCFNEHGLV